MAQQLFTTTDGKTATLKLGPYKGLNAYPIHSDKPIEAGSFEGELVWQFNKRGMGVNIWITDSAAQEKFENFSDYKAHMNSYANTRQAVQPVTVKGEGKVEPDFIEWCKKERINFSNGMLHKFNWYRLRPEQRVVAENFMICFDQLFGRFKSTHAFASANMVDVEKAIKKLDDAVIIDSNCGVEYQTGYNDGLTEAINILKNLTIKE